MGRVSGDYLEKVGKWLMNGVDLNVMNMSLNQKFRSRIVYEVYQIWLQNKQIKASDIFKNIARREYALMLDKANKGDEMAQQYVDSLGIKPGVSRTSFEISNDVETLNYIIARFDVPVNNIEKAKVQDASDWLINQGMKMGDARAVKSGADLKMQLYNNFDDKDDPQSQMANTDINLTGDVSVVKSGRVNYTEEEKKKYARKFGVSISDVNDMIESEGVFVEVEEME